MVSATKIVLENLVLEGQDKEGEIYFFTFIDADGKEAATATAHAPLDDDKTYRVVIEEIVETQAGS